MEPKCCRCGKPLPPNEQVAYGNRCEDCWCYCPGNQWPNSAWSGAQCYGDSHRGQGNKSSQPKEVSYQGPQSNRWFRGSL